jgi:hypothetical protein
MKRLETNPVIAACGLTLVAGALAWSLIQPAADERWFMPGAWGYEPGAVDSMAQQTRHNGYLTRAMTVGGGREGDVWKERNHLTPRFGFSHNLANVFPAELYDRHPEYFPWVEGRRFKPSAGSYSWNPDLGRKEVAQHAAEVAGRFFDEHPDAESFALGVNDGLIFGSSADTRALVTPLRWFRDRPDYSSLVFTFMNRAAAALRPAHPDKYLGALAYYWAENAPDFAVDPQVVPFLTADRSQGYDDAFRREELLLQRRWSRALHAAPRLPAQSSKLKAHGSRLKAPSSSLPAQGSPSSAPPIRLGLYDYLYGDAFLVPRIHTQLLAENLRQAHRVGFTDYYAEANPNWGLDGPMPWLAAQLLRNPEQSPDALLDEYYTRFFGAAAGPMRRFFEACEQQWMTQPGPAYWLKYYCDESQAALFPSPVCRELRRWLTEAEGRAGSERAQQRVRFVSEAFGMTERFVAMQEARTTVLRDALQPPRAQSPVPQKENREPRAGGGEQGTPNSTLTAQCAQLIAGLRLFHAARAEWVRYTGDLQKRKPLAIAPFPWTFYLRNDPTARVLEAIHAAAADAGELAAADRAVRAISAPEVPPLWAGIAARMGPERLNNADLGGTLVPSREILGLHYGLQTPEGWGSFTEPWRTFREAWSAGTSRVLRLEGNKKTLLYQGCEVASAGVHRAGMHVRGRVSRATNVSLHLEGFDGAEKRLLESSCRLPEGEWDDWVELTVAAVVPAGVTRLNVALAVQNQVDGDWIEVRGFSLRSAVP